MENWLRKINLKKMISFSFRWKSNNLCLMHLPILWIISIQLFSMYLYLYLSIYLCSNLTCEIIRFIHPNHCKCKIPWTPEIIWMSLVAKEKWFKYYLYGRIFYWKLSIIIIIPFIYENNIFMCHFPFVKYLIVNWCIVCISNMGYKQRFATAYYIIIAGYTCCIYVTACCQLHCMVKAMWRSNFVATSA